MALHSSQNSDFGLTST